MSLSVPDFSQVKVLVAGDLMLDEYWFGPTSRISPEAPVPVVRVTKNEARAGGAANVAVNLASLGATTICAGVVGKDAQGAALKDLLVAQGIRPVLSESADRPTITKLRVLSRNQQLIRLDTEQRYDVDEADMVAAELRKHIKDVDVCILSDYAKGTLCEAQQLIATCRDAGTPVLVDPKGSDFTRYRGATLLTPNLAEFEAVVGKVLDDESLLARAESLREDLDLQALVVTLSERGILVVQKDSPPEIMAARAREVFDVTGAGDTVIAALAATIGAGLSFAAAASLANLAAGLVVRKIGVASVTPSELNLALHEQGQGGRGLLSRSDVAQIVAEAQNRGERVVMTNGCFDILHTGHVSYLQDAKSLGDRLLVAVNADESVQRLKGEGRPINPLEDRMAVLAGLAAVDWVVEFSEDTPEELIRDVKPDVLVKGGDYTVDTIAGADFVLDNGGTVEVLMFKEGRSTSKIVESIRKLP
jgi:D-beta-D-heptose 7-phosphate kinase/D-beta-D-heptose 1-phosphate adenosyltransferase